MMLAADLLLGTAKDAKTLLASGHLDDAEQTMWRGIQAAQRELQGEGKAPELKDNEAAGGTSA